MSSEDRLVDVVIVGSGGGALTAALRAVTLGLEPLVLEKTEYVGGATAMSGGGMWVPNNPLMKAEGIQDSSGDAQAYFRSVVGDVGPQSSIERRASYIANSPKMVEFLQTMGVRFKRAAGWPDYYSESPGGKADGRSVEPTPFDTRQLGAWEPRLRPGITMGIGIVATTSELMRLGYWNRSIKGMVTGLRVVGRTKVSKWRGRSLVSHGAALIGMLLEAAIARGVPIWTDSPVEELVVEDGRVVGVVVVHEGERITVRARKAVLLAAGGYAMNQEMRDKFAPHQPGGFTYSNPGDTGEMLVQAMKLGAATAQLDEALWTPNPAMPDGSPALFQAASMGIVKTRPGAILVDQDGERFTNEAGSHMDIGQAMFARNAAGRSVPSWAVFDDRARRRYTFDRVPGQLKKELIDGGFVIRADTLEELAAACKVDPTGLAATVQRWNTMVANGRDEDFARGEGAYNRYQGDPLKRGNNGLAPISRAPYYAVAYVPGDVATLGGVLTDEHARVLDESGQPIPGLYAAGNIAATVMGRTYPGPGASIAHTCTFGMVAVDHVAAGS
ncbi:FAD-dependent oxidoreductase [Nocardioides sp. WS12]|uniref:FAD-dependent oxidoreductase n=1 Tax=Nocardioides sp. WS12 TaxID=2486272 RepID=UPI0015FD07D4|nr:FAD-dependent oxidoreductase [Nocardioides sp. WS12]